MTDFYTLRQTLRELSEQGPAVTVRAGANSPFGREGRRVNPGALLDALARLTPEELDRLTIYSRCISGTGEYAYNRREEIGEIHLFTPEGRYQPEPVLLVYQAQQTAAAPADRGEQIGRQEGEEREQGQQGQASEEGE